MPQYIDTTTLILQQYQIQTVLKTLLMQRPELTNYFLRDPHNAFAVYMGIKFDPEVNLQCLMSTSPYNFVITLPKKIERTHQSLDDDDLSVVAAGRGNLFCSRWRNWRNPLASKI